MINPKLRHGIFEGSKTVTGRTTKVSKSINASPADIYEAHLNPNKLVKWRVPKNMEADIHEFEARAGGSYRMTLTYVNAADAGFGKTSDGKDSFKGQFVELIPHKKIVERIDFESVDPKFAGQMKMTTTIADGEMSEVTIVCEDIPEGIRLEDNVIGCEEALSKLAQLLE